MPINKQIVDDVTGATFEYWKLGNVNIFHDRKIAKIEILGYLTRDAFLANPNQFIARQYDCVDIPEYTNLNGEVTPAKLDYTNHMSPNAQNPLGVNAQKQGYVFIKTHPDFVGATDVDL